MESFKANLLPVSFKTKINNREATLGFVDVFANRRIVIYSLPTLLTIYAWNQLRAYEQANQAILDSGIDQVYCINSNAESRMLPYYAARLSQTVIALPDLDTALLQNIQQEFSIDKELKDLARLWQYIIIVNDGVPEKLFSNPLKKNMPLRIVKSGRYQYHNLGPDVVLKYLTTQEKISKITNTN
jgi:peroxiredoxin